MLSPSRTSVLQSSPRRGRRSVWRVSSSVTSSSLCRDKTHIETGAFILCAGQLEWDRTKRGEWVSSDLWEPVSENSSADGTMGSWEGGVYQNSGGGSVTAPDSRDVKSLKTCNSLNFELKKGSGYAVRTSDHCDLIYTGPVLSRRAVFFVRVSRGTRDSKSPAGAADAPEPEFQGRPVKVLTLNWSSIKPIKRMYWYVLLV